MSIRDVTVKNNILMADFILQSECLIHSFFDPLQSTSNQEYIGNRVYVSPTTKSNEIMLISWYIKHKCMINQLRYIFSLLFLMKSIKLKY